MPNETAFQIFPQDFDVLKPSGFRYYIVEIDEKAEGAPDRILKLLARHHDHAEAQQGAAKFAEQISQQKPGYLITIGVVDMEPPIRMMSRKDSWVNPGFEK